ncbi:hypothetical protein [Phenylobacterium koreense]|uniref:DUF2726 domain-containing protein n=1 Tax=Phenylobacterium koreense TaxID=266125 RepID=A0ABV2EIN5_9CAUL
MWADVATGFVGVLGVVLGVVVNEMLRRRNRIESYSARVFDRRLAIYEELSAKMVAARSVANDVMTNPIYSGEERHEIMSCVILDMAGFADKNALFIDSDLSAHCVAAFMGAEDVFEMPIGAEREEAKRAFWAMDANAQRMIREDSGVAEISKLFKKINKPTLSSPIIDRIRELRSASSKRA